VQRLFWRYFFRLLIFTAAVALWACIAWMLIVVAGIDVPWWMHVAGPLVVHLLNRLVLHSGAPNLHRPALERVYVSVVFASLFGLVFLLLNGTFWGLAGAWLGVASMAGLPVEPGHALAAAQVLGSVGLVTVAAAVAHGYLGGQRELNVLPLEIELPGLDPVFDGYRVIQISDIHLGNFMDAETIAPHVSAINMLAPDLLVITGDVTDGTRHAPLTFTALGKLRARDGVLAILGNHDFYSGADEVTALLRRYTDFTVLRNEHVAIARGQARLHVIGLDDAGLDWARGVREHEALPPLRAQIDEDAPTILLSHRPDLFGQAAGLGIGLTLAGHTHGGQLALPWPRTRHASLAHFMTAYPRGTYRHGQSMLHVNMGLGVTAQPIRLWTPREITLITLRAPRSQGDLQ